MDIAISVSDYVMYWLNHTLFLQLALCIHFRSLRIGHIWPQCIPLLCFQDPSSEQNCSILPYLGTKKTSLVYVLYTSGNHAFITELACVQYRNICKRFAKFPISSTRLLRNVCKLFRY